MGDLSISTKSCSRPIFVWFPWVFAIAAVYSLQTWCLSRLPKWRRLIMIPTSAIHAQKPSSMCFQLSGSVRWRAGILCQLDTVAPGFYYVPNLWTTDAVASPGKVGRLPVPDLALFRGWDATYSKITLKKSCDKAKDTKNQDSKQQPKIKIRVSRSRIRGLSVFFQDM